MQYQSGDGSVIGVLLSLRAGLPPHWGGGIFFKMTVGVIQFKFIITFTPLSRLTPPAPHNGAPKLSVALMKQLKPGNPPLTPN